MQSFNNFCEYSLADEIDDFPLRISKGHTEKLQKALVNDAGENRMAGTLSFEKDPAIFASRR